MSAWAVLRQVVVATTDHDGDLAAVRSAFGLGQGFDDPELKHLGLGDATMPVSADPARYLEFVTPLDDHGAVGRWLGKVGTRGGHTLSVQHPDPAGVLARCAEAGVRVPVDEMAFGRRVLQLHPKDVGLVLEVDGIDDPAVWFWDDIDPGPEPGAAVDAVVGIEVAVAEPEQMAALWVKILDLPAPVEPTLLDLGGASVRFVAGGPSPAWTVLLRRRAGSDVQAPTLPGLTFRLV